MGFFLFEKPSEWNKSLSTGSGALGLVVSASKWPTPKPEAENPIVSYWVEGYQLWDQQTTVGMLLASQVLLSGCHRATLQLLWPLVFFFFFS